MKRITFFHPQLTRLSISLKKFSILFSCLIQILQNWINYYPNLNLKKSCDLFGISNKVIKSSSVVIIPFLIKLYNACMKCGVFPNIFKTAQVIPLFKGGNREDVNCYRPISLLPILGKIFEKIISTRVVSFCDKFNLISPEQFGFRAKYSTEFAVLDIYEKLLHNLDTELSSCAIFLDLAKAFDSVSHNILLRKLQKYGFRGKVMSSNSFSLTYNQDLSLSKLIILLLP